MTTEISCSQCKKFFTNKYTLKTHQKVHSQRARDFKCEIKGCEKTFLNKTHLENHHKVVHDANLERNFICTLCSKSFKSQSNLRTHEAVHSDKCFLCRFCDKTFSRSQDVKIHERVHKDEKFFSCEQCKKSFKQQSNLIEHVKKVRLIVSRVYRFLIQLLSLIPGPQASQTLQMRSMR